MEHIENYSKSIGLDPRYYIFGLKNKHNIFDKFDESFMTNGQIIRLYFNI